MNWISNRAAHPSKTIALALLGFAMLSASPARAHEDPPGCNETGASINVGIFRDANATVPLTGAVSPCEIIYYRAVLTKVAPQVPGDTVCAFSGGQFDFKTPNGAVTVISNPVPCIGATVGNAGEGCVAGVDSVTSPVIQYTVNPADVSGGLISALSTYGIAGGISGVAHDGATNTPGVTQSTPKQTSVLSCNDGNACTIDVCDMPLEHGAAGCSHNPVNCNDGNACTADGCDPASGCFHTDISAQCDDDNACTTDVCNPETGCVHTPIVCNDGNACTADSCDPATGCTHSAINCNDSNACTIDGCDPATGCTHSAVNCNDSNACTIDACDPATGCTHTAVVCNDGNACTADSCNPASGCVHTDTSGQCNDNNACTTDGCNPATGCTHTDNSSSCNDNNACTTDGCNPATGCTHSAVVCNDGNACTADSCNPATGCVHTDTSANCNDQNACTTDTCNPETGCVHTPVVCNDGSACTADSCNPETGCVHSAINCNDNNACTQDGCNPASGCTHTDTSSSCNDNNACTQDGCNPATGCTHTDTSSQCDDDNVCTTDSCVPATGCAHTPITCDDGDICTDDACNPQTGCTHTFDASNDASCAPAICRTPGFWGTHGAASQKVIDHVGGCMEVCGEVITNVSVANANSALEAICVSPRGDQRLQLVRQMTAMALNCGMSDFGSDCGDPGAGLGELFSDCNNACLGLPSDRSIGDCIGDIDCFNNGGSPDPETGICGENPAGSCHARSLPDFIGQASADTPKECNAARKNECSVVPPGEKSGLGFCTAGGTIQANPESCN